MSFLDRVVGIKAITTDGVSTVPTRGTLHFSGPAATVRDDPDAEETVLALGSPEGAAAYAVTTESLDADVLTLTESGLTGLDAANVVRFVIADDVAVHGMEAPTAGGNPRKTFVLLQGAGANRLELKHMSASTAATARFACPGGASYFLLDSSSIDVLYDATSGVWRLIP